VTAPTFHRITVAIDGSQIAEAALDCAIDLAHRYGSDLVILSVAPIVPVYIGPNEPFVPAGVPPSEIGHYQQIVDAAVKRAEAAGVTSVTGVGYEGVIVDEILSHLDEHATDLFVIGSRGLSAAKRLLLGSVSDAVVHHAPCPVLIVRPTATKPAGG
jgi:nucleotide-binding universal stress UspA family protein